MQKTQLSVTAQIALALGCILLFSLILTFTGFMASNQESQKMAAFASDGAVATGTIVKKSIDSVRPTAGGIWVYWLDVSFRSADGATHKASENVANSIYDRYDVGSPVQITYVKSKPEWFYVPGDEPTQRSVGMSAGMNQFGIFGAVLSAFGLVAVFFFTRSSGTPPANTPVMREPAETPLRRLSNQPRSNFGTRRAGR